MIPMYPPPSSRFIPTHVGNTITEQVQDVPCAVHPHTRGEHTEKDCSRYSANGSSPHTWGTPGCPGCTAEWSRFIPTHVGNTLAVVFGPGSTPVHPHTRGEHANDRKNR